MSLYKGTQLISGAMPNSANQSLSNLNSAGQDKFDAKVSKSGDTMTGDLAFKFSNLDLSTTVSVATYRGVAILDTNGERVGRVEGFQKTNGDYGISIGTKVYGVNTYPKLEVWLDSSNVAHSSFPNTTCCDGQFVQVGRNIVTSSVSLNGSSILSYTLSEIANKGYNHMALITATISTGSASGNYCNLEITTDIMSTSAYITRVKTQAASTQTTAGSVWVPVSTSGKIYFYRNTAWHGTLDLLRIVGYRRIGTNS